MENLEGIRGNDLSKYGIEVEEVGFTKKSTKFKILKGLFQEIFSVNEDSFFCVEPLFMDVCSNKGKKVSLRLRLCSMDNSKIFDKDYFDNSSKRLEIYSKKYFGVAETFKREYEKRFKNKIKLDYRF
jgi:hypothetical protein